MTEDPRRMLDDDATSSVLRRDLANARSSDLDYDVDAAIARFEAGLAAAPAPASEAVAGAKRGATWWLVGGGAVAAAAFAWSIGRDSTPARVDPPSSAPASPAVVQSPAIEPPRAIEPITPPRAIAPPPATPPEISPAPMRKARAPASPPPIPSAPDHDDTLAREMAATAAAKRALASDPARALELVADANREFGTGVYAEDREGIAVLALARLGRDAEAVNRGKAYLAAHPKGSYADRIRGVLGASAENP